MKNKFIYIFITLLLFFFVSCSNGFVFSKSNGIEKMAKVSFLLEGENKSSSRTMKPVFSKNDFVKLELVAFKKYSEGNYSSSPIELFDEPLKTDETSDCYTKLCSEEFELLEGVYKFCLYAYTNSDGYIFRGITEQDIFADATNEVIFTLLPYGSQETPDVDKKDWGHLNLKFYIPDNIKRVTAGMFFGSDNFFNFGVPVIVGDDDENHIYSDPESYYYEQIELEIANDNDGKGNYVIYSDTLEEYLLINNGKSGLPNGTYGIWVRGFLAPKGDPSILGWDIDAWATEYRELIWIANGKTTTAERTIQGKYDGFAYFDVEGVLPGLTIPCGYTNGTVLDENLIPEEYRPKGLLFTGWSEVVYNQTTGDYDLIPVPAGTVLDATTIGKQYYAAYVFTITIPKFKGNDGLQDTTITTWDYYTDLDCMPYIMDYPSESACDWEKLTEISFVDYIDQEHRTASFVISGDDMRENTDSHLTAFFTDCGDIGYQTQKANNDITDLVGTDELWASFYSGNDSTYEFRHARSVVKFNFTGLPADKKIRTMALYVPGDYIPFDVSGDENGFPIFNTDGSFNFEQELPEYNHALDSHFYLTLSEDEVDFDSGSIVNPITQGFNPASDGSMTLYSMFYPKDFTGKTVICTLIDENEDYYVAYLDGKNLKAGNIYQYNAAPQKIAKSVMFKTSASGEDIVVNTVNKGAYSPEDPGFYVNFTDANVDEIGLEYWETFCYDSTITWTWGTSHGVNGFYVTGNGNNNTTASVFIPAGGYKNKPAQGEEREYNPVVEYGTSMKCWTGETITPESGVEYGYAIYGTQEDPGVLGYFDKNEYLRNVRIVEYAN